VLVDKVKLSYLKLTQSAPLVFILEKLEVLLPFVLLFVAGFVVRTLLIEYTYDELVHDISSIPKLNIFLAILLTILNYLILTCYDYLGTLYVKAKIPFSKVAMASFVAYSFSQNLGMSLLSGGAVRYRFYQRENISGADIARIIGFTAFHFWLGLFFLAGILTVLYPESFSEVFHVTDIVCRLIGIGILLPSVVYLCFLIFPNIIAERYRRVLPSRKLGFAGLFVCVADWLLASCVFYFILTGEHEITLIRTIVAFISAQVAGVMSHVPGGLGVFEATVAYLLSPHHDNSALIASLIVFRLIYYFIPFILSVILLSTVEIATKVKSVRTNDAYIASLGVLESVFKASLPLINSLFVIASGILLLFCESVPRNNLTPTLFYKAIPLPLYELSFFLGSTVGVLLVFIGVSLQRRIRQTSQVCLILLSFALILSFVQVNYFETSFMLLNLIILFYTRGAFYRTGSFLNSSLRARWIWTLAVVMISVLFGLFAFEDLDYSWDLWFTFELYEFYPRFLRSILGMILGLIVCTYIFALKRPKLEEPKFPTISELAEIEKILGTTSDTMGLLSYALDKEILFSENRDAFLMWRRSGSSVVSMGGPHGNKESFSELFWKFREIAEEQAKLCSFYEISSDMMPYVLDLGLRAFKIGEEGVVDLNAFTLVGSRAGTFRTILNKIKKQNTAFRVMEKTEVVDRIGELRDISDEWLAHKNTAEKGFSLGYFNEEYVSKFRCAVIEKENMILGFCNMLESGQRVELAIDLMRHREKIPNGIMDFLFISLFEWGKEQGYQSFSLGMAPLSGLADNPLAPNYAKFGNLVYRHGGHFYNFDGLRNFKDKFHPTWSPRYVACPGSIYLPIVLSNISVLISRGLKSLVGK